MKVELFPFVEKINSEAVDLLVDARDYMGCSNRYETLSSKDLGRIVSENFRVTSRLAGVVAWVLYRKGVKAGEIEEADVPSVFDGSDGDFSCLNAKSETIRYLPAKLRSLLERSRQLFDRVARLEETTQNNMIDQARE